jgi:hypothetical protein
MNDPLYDSVMGNGPRRIAQMEKISCPDAETHITGVDYYEHPRLCRQRMNQLYPHLDLPVPATDNPIAPPALSLQGQSSDSEDHTVRWGDGVTGTWQHGESIFHTPAEVFAFSPLEKADFSDWPVVMRGDFSSEEVIYQRHRSQFPAHWRSAPPGEYVSSGFYNTLFMWPMLTFGWELFLECALDPRFDRIMDEFAEISRRVFSALSRLPVHFIQCHDDIVTSRGPTFSPRWMHRHIFPRYEEFFSIIKAAGKEPIFVVDGCMDAYVDDVLSCGARGLYTEPYTDFRAIARKYDDPFLAGEGDVRIIMQNDRAEIKKMVLSMVETARMSGGYVLASGNDIGWNVPPEAIRYYLDISAELGYR